jgi:hypothetical protein
MAAAIHLAAGGPVLPNAADEGRAADRRFEKLRHYISSYFEYPITITHGDPEDPAVVAAALRALEEALRGERSEVMALVAENAGSAAAALEEEAPPGAPAAAASASAAAAAAAPPRAGSQTWRGPVGPA